MTVGGVELVGFAKKLAHEFSADDISGLAAELSYRYFLALFPFMIFLAALGGFTARAVNADDPTGTIMDNIGGALPADARSVLETQVRTVLDSHSLALLSFGIIGALWAASGAMKALIKAMNRAYDVAETRPFWKVTSLAIGMTVAATIGLLGSAALYLATSAWGGAIADSLGAGRLFRITLSIVRWPIIVALLMVAVGLLYWMAPNLKLPFKWISPGAAIFTVVWIVATLGFGFYVSHFSSYSNTYGALGGVVVLMTWLYITNITLFIGAEINALLDEAKEPRKADSERAARASEASPEEKKKSMEPAAIGPGKRQQPGREVAAAERSAVEHKDADGARSPGGGGTLGGIVLIGALFLVWATSIRRRA